MLKPPVPPGGLNLGEEVHPIGLSGKSMGNRLNPRANSHAKIQLREEKIKKVWAHNPSNCVFHWLLAPCGFSVYCSARLRRRSRQRPRPRQGLGADHARHRRHRGNRRGLDHPWPRRRRQRTRRPHGAPVERLGGAEGSNGHSLRWPHDRRRVAVGDLGIWYLMN